MISVWEKIGGQQGLFSVKVLVLEPMPIAYK